MTDGADEEITYVPISGLIEGDTSQEIQFKIVTPKIGLLTATDDPRLLVFAKKVGGAYQNIVTSPIDLSVLAAGNTSFLVYVEALSPIVGLERIPISIIASESSAAGWKS